MLPQLSIGIRWASWLLLVLAACGATTSRAQEGDLEDLVDVSYIHAVVFPTGTYSVRNRRVTMLKVPFSWKERPATAERAGRRWLATTVLGYDDLSGVDSDFIARLLPDQLLTLSVMPGVELIYPAGRRWQVKPFVEVGGGHDFSYDESYALTQLGVRGLATYDLSDIWAVRLGLALRWAGEYVFDAKEGQGFGIVDVGLDVRRGLPWRLFDQRLDAGAYYIWERYLPEMTFGEAPDWRGRAVEVHEFGLSLGVPHGRRIFGIPVKRVRVGYKKGGKLQGWTFGTEFPF